MVVLGNPFREQITIRYNSTESNEIRFQLADMNGRTVRSEKVAVNAGSGLHELREFGSIPAGTYLLRVTINGQQFNQKVLKH